MKMSRVFLGSLIAAAAALASAQHASAQCAADSDCRPGYVCKTEDSTICSGQAPACAPDEMCPPPEPPTCESYQYSYCTSAPCAADADCPSDMVCWAQPQTECSVSGTSGGTTGGSAGSAGSSAPCGPDEMCGGTVECHEVPGEAVCVARYVPPCHVDADCGGGFSCVEQIGYECSGGSAGSGAPATGGVGDPGEMKPADDSSCSEVPTGQFYCQLQDLPCESDADCPGSLKCHENWSYTCSGSGGSGGGVATAGSGGSVADPMADSPSEPAAMEPSEPVDAGVGRGDDVVCESVVLSKTCSPEDWYYPGPGMGAGGYGGTPAGGEADAGVGQDNSGSMTPGSTGSGSSAGASGGGRGGSGGSAGDDGDSESHHGSHHGGGLFGHHGLGCSVNDADASGALWSSLGLIGFVAVTLRRRSRRSI